MRKKIEAIVENGILGLLEEYLDWYGQLSENARVIFETLFEDDELNLSKNGQNIVNFWSESISNSCTEQEINFAYECTNSKETELNENFFNIFPKMFATILLQLKALKIENDTLTKEQEVAYQVIDYLGRETLGNKKFVKMVQEEVTHKNQNEDEEKAGL